MDKTNQMECGSRGLLLSQRAHVRASRIQTFFIRHHDLPITNLRKLVVKVKENTKQESFVPYDRSGFCLLRGVGDQARMLATSGREIRHT